VELGAAYLTFDDAFIDGAELDNSWDVNAKWSFAQLLGGKTAVGAQFLQLQATDIELGDVNVDFTQAYLAWTRLFCFSEGNQSLAWTLGANWTQFDPDFGDSDSDFRYFTSLELGLTRMFAVIAEYQTESDKVGDASPISTVAARIRINPTIAAQFGTTNALGPVGLSDHNFFAGLTFSFGGAQNVQQ
jgi:hypothetical protein